VANKPNVPTYGAVYSAAQEKWFGWYWSGSAVRNLPGRRTRDLALGDARRYHDRARSPEMPDEPTVTL
jgi:hypothetical protein